MTIFCFTSEPYDGFECQSSLGIVCLFIHQVCDTFMHCIDGSDEAECGQKLNVVGITLY